MNYCGPDIWRFLWLWTLGESSSLNYSNIKLHCNARSLNINYLPFLSNFLDLFTRKVIISCLEIRRVTICSNFISKIRRTLYRSHPTSISKLLNALSKSMELLKTFFAWQNFPKSSKFSSYFAEFLQYNYLKYFVMDTENNLSKIWRNLFNAFLNISELL